MLSIFENVDHDNLSASMRFRGKPVNTTRIN
jgi:hypothetical protein